MNRQATFNNAVKIVRKRVFKNEEVDYMDPLMITKNLNKPGRYGVSTSILYTDSDYLIAKGIDMNNEDNSAVTIKFQPPDLGDDKVIKEYELLCKLEDINVPGVQRAINYAPNILICTWDGNSLNDEIIMGGLPSVKRVIHYFKQMTKSVRDLTRVNLEHSNINPSTVLVSLDKTTITLTDVLSVKTIVDQQENKKLINQSLGNMLYYMLKGCEASSSVRNSEMSRVFDTKIGLLLETMLNDSRHENHLSVDALYEKVNDIADFYAGDLAEDVQTITTRVIRRYIPCLSSGMLTCANLTSVDTNSLVSKDDYLYFPLPPPYLTGNGYVVSKGKHLNSNPTEHISFVFMPDKPEESAKLVSYSRPGNAISGLLKAICHVPEILITLPYDCTLEMVIESVAPSEEDCLSYFEQILKFAIEFRTYRSMVNLDIRPANILVNLNRAQAVVCDIENVAEWNNNIRKHTYYGYEARSCEELMSYTFGLLLYAMMTRNTDRDFLLQVSKGSCAELRCSKSIRNFIYSMLTTSMSLGNIHEETKRLRGAFGPEGVGGVEDAAVFAGLNL